MLLRRSSAVSFLALCIVAFVGCGRKSNDTPVNPMMQPDQPTTKPAPVPSTAPTTSTDSATSTTPAHSSTDLQTNPPTEKTYTAQDVAVHAVKSDCWIAVETSVYDITKFFGQHPAGDDALAADCGKAVTNAFNSHRSHGSARAKDMLSKFRIGAYAGN